MEDCICAAESFGDVSSSSVWGFDMESYILWCFIMTGANAAQGFLVQVSVWQETQGKTSAGKPTYQSFFHSGESISV